MTNPVQRYVGNVVFDSVPTMGTPDIGDGYIVIKKIAISATPTGAAQDTGFDLPIAGMVLDAWVEVTTAEATGTTKTLDVGLLASESGGDADGFIDGISVASLGTYRPGATVTGGVYTANVRGVLLSDYAQGADADDRGLYVPKPHVLNGTAKSVVYTAGSNNFAEFRGNIWLAYYDFTLT